MNREGSIIRKRNDKNDTSSKRKEVSPNLNDENDESKMNRSLIMRLVMTVFGSYKILLLFTIIVFTLQILVGVSFFHTFSHRFSPKPHSQDSSRDEKIDVSGIQSQLKSDSNVSFPCDITGKDSLSAIKRASSIQCKQEIVDLICAIERGEVYPKQLPRYCQSKIDVLKAGEYVGCFKDSFNQRLFQGDMIKFKTDNSHKKCVNHCLDNGFSFAGLQYGVECFCGNNLPKSGKLEQESCNMSCPGSDKMTCGGYLTMEILSTGLVPLVPSKTGATGEVTGDQVKIVYLLTIAGRASRQVARLIKQIYSPQHYILVHVDSRQEYMYREMEKLSSVLPNMRLMSNRYSTIWGGASLLTMLVSAMRELLEMKDWNWDFMLNLSESDFPVKTQRELVEFLSNNRESNFVKGHGREQDKFVKKQGLDKTFYECDTHMWRLGERTLPSGVQIDGGSDWICLNRNFANYVVNSNDELVTGLRKVFEYTLLPAESFFHTVLRNSEYCHSYIDNNLHLTNWKRKQGCKCQYKHIVDWCGCSPNDFVPEDWNKLENTKARQIFFARKFEPIVHQGILNRVEEWFSNKTISESPAKLSYWQNIYHHKDSKHDFDPSNLIPLLKDLISTQFQNTVSFEKVKTLTAFTYNDKLNSTLALVEVKTGDMSSNTIRFDLELRINHIPIQKVAAKFSDKLSSYGVGASFDPKELIFRNYIGLLDQNSKLALRMHYATNESKHEEIEVAWFDPLQKVIALTKLSFNRTSLIEASSPKKLNQPLLPGVYTVLAVKNSEFLFSEQFLITSNSQDPAINLEIENSESFKKIANENNVFDESLSDKIELSLMQNLYQIEGICSTNDELEQVPSCDKTSWSSLYPDEKSKIIGVNPETGFLS